MKHFSACRRAFTLIEILVVVAIIALLAGLLFPVFGRVREEGRKTACLSNMKQLGLAFQQYAQDSRGKYPGAASFYEWAPGNGAWVAGTAGDAGRLAALAPDASGNAAATGQKADVEAGALFPYVKSTAVYVCPSNRDGEIKGVTYSMNCALSRLSVAKIRSPGDIVLLVDEEYATDGYFFAVNDGPPGNPAGSTTPFGTTDSTDALTVRHNGGGNLLFADGHVKYYPYDNFVLDGTVEGKKNKWKTAGAPRFHDRAFGPYGSSTRTGASVDYCNATLGPGTADGAASIPPTP